jgi:hypothetical protein
MKNIFILIHFCFLSLSAFSQTEKGSMLIGGTASGYLPFNIKGLYTLSLSPKVGYFLCRNFAVGINPYGTITHYYYKDSFKGNTSSIGIGPFLRYYVGKSKLRPFIEGGFSYAHLANSTKNLDGNTASDSKSHRNYLSEHIGIGMVYFINSYVGIETNLIYQHTNQKIYQSAMAYYPQSTYTNSYGNLTLSVGFQIYIPAAKKESVEQK